MSLDTAAIRAEHRRHRRKSCCAACGGSGYPCDTIRLCDALDAAEKVIADAKAECLRVSASWSVAMNTSTRARLDAVLAILSGPDGEATDG